MSALCCFFLTSLLAEMPETYTLITILNNPEDGGLQEKEVGNDEVFRTQGGGGHTMALGVEKTKRISLIRCCCCSCFFFRFPFFVRRTQRTTHESA
uniref:Putative secreted protein n=1 Tax=Ixodes ricinus TaxID=34613 RepID=A0A6B0UDA0_IXORI